MAPNESVTKKNLLHTYIHTYILPYVYVVTSWDKSVTTNRQRKASWGPQGCHNWVAPLLTKQAAMQNILRRCVL